MARWTTPGWRARIRRALGQSIAPTPGRPMEAPGAPIELLMEQAFAHEAILLTMLNDWANSGADPIEALEGLKERALAAMRECAFPNMAPDYAGRMRWRAASRIEQIFGAFEPK